MDQKITITTIAHLCTYALWQSLVGEFEIAKRDDVHRVEDTKDDALKWWQDHIKFKPTHSELLLPTDVFCDAFIAPAVRAFHANIAHRAAQKGTKLVTFGNIEESHDISAMWAKHELHGVSVRAMSAHDVQNDGEQYTRIDILYGV